MAEGVATVAEGVATVVGIQASPSRFLAKSRIPAELFHCIYHRKDIFWGDIGQNGVCGRGHISTIFS